jgi:hypothetical protein
MLTNKRQLILLACLLLMVVLPQLVFAHGMSEADQQAALEGGNLRFISLGASHMMTGYDHLLFLFGVIFFLTKFKQIVKFITAFTVGHCITLVAATFMGITANYYLIDAVIALTVVYKGFDNLDGFKRVFKRESPNLLVLVFAFGLIHGFGLSSRLQQLPLDMDNLLLNILSFNLGVELGQIIALAVMLVLLNLWRKKASFKKFSKVSNIGLVLAGIYLFSFQMYGFSTEPTVEVEWQDTITVTVPAEKGIEYKFYGYEGNEFEYSWQSDSTQLYFDFHGEPSGDTTGYFKSYKTGTSSTDSGSFVAPFEGIHGWYWRNKSTTDAIVTLQARGEYKRLDLAD